MGGCIVGLIFSWAIANFLKLVITLFYMMPFSFISWKFSFLMWFFGYMFGQMAIGLLPKDLNHHTYSILQLGTVDDIGIDTGRPCHFVDMLDYSKAEN